jgi:hypothetical protein
MYRETYKGQPIKVKRIRMQSRGHYVSNDGRYNVIHHELDSVG